VLSGQLDFGLHPSSDQAVNSYAGARKFAAVFPLLLTASGSLPSILSSQHPAFRQTKHVVNPGLARCEHTNPFVPGISGRVCKAGKCREHSALSLVGMRRSYRISRNV
jgi:hypothetical protein